MDCLSDRPVVASHPLPSSLLCWTANDINLITIAIFTFFSFDRHQRSGYPAVGGVLHPALHDLPGLPRLLLLHPQCLHHHPLQVPHHQGIIYYLHFHWLITVLVIASIPPTTLHFTYLIWLNKSHDTDWVQTLGQMFSVSQKNDKLTFLNILVCVSFIARTSTL